MGPQMFGDWRREGRGTLKFYVAQSLIQNQQARWGTDQVCGGSVTAAAEEGRVAAL